MYMNKELSFLRVSESNFSELSQGVSDLHFTVHKQKYELSYWRSRYLKNPVGKSNLIVAVRNGRVVGKYGLLYIPLVVRGKSVVAGLMSGLSIYPFERSWQCYRGLVDKSIDESREDNLAFRFGVCFHKMVEFNQRMGVTILGRMPVHSGFLNVRRMLEGRSIPYPLSLSGCFIQHIVGLKIRRKKICNLDIRAIKNFNAVFDELWSFIAKKYIVSLIKDAAYLNWRYADCPGKQYGRLAAYDGNRLEGFVVFSTTGIHYSSCILELLARDDNPEVMRELLLHVFSELRTQKVGSIAASFSPGSQKAVVLQELGFKLWGVETWPAHILIAARSPEEVYPDISLKSCEFSLGDWDIS